MEIAAPPPPVVTPAAKKTGGPAVDFRNPLAVRIGLTIAIGAGLLTAFFGLGFVVWWPSAGFLSVYLYHRRTGERLTVSSGVRMGWITGVFTFAIVTLLSTALLVMIALQKGGLAAWYQEQLRTMQASEVTIQQAMQAFSSPLAVFIGILVMLTFMFAIMTGLCAAGGALGARVLRRD